MNMFAADRCVDSCMVRVENGDTLYMAWLHEVWVYPPMQFKSKRQEKFYWRTVRDVKKCLPYAKMITLDMKYADAELAKRRQEEMDRGDKAFTPPCRKREVSKSLKAYAKMVTSADKGAVREL